MHIKRTYSLLLFSTILYVSLLTIFQPFTPKQMRNLKIRPGIRTVLYYNRVFFEDPITLFGDRDVHICSADCQVTSNREYLSEADTVIFHAWDDFYAMTVGAPTKEPSQKWIYYNNEPPTWLQWFQMGLFTFHGEQVDGVMSYRTDSDIYIPYGRIIEKKKVEPFPHLPIKKEAKVAWFVSNCKAYSRREELANQLSKFLPVHIYGKCGSYSCPRDDEAVCNRMLEREYTFYLAFENSLCRDYVTEKIYRTLKLNVIPVVLTHPNNLKFLPVGSYIDAGSFKSVQSLAEYMQTVAKNETLYNSFFQWKSRYEAEQLFFREVWCAPCHQTIIRNRTMRRDADSWKDWWFKDADCITWPYVQ